MDGAASRIVPWNPDEWKSIETLQDSAGAPAEEQIGAGRGLPKADPPAVPQNAMFFSWKATSRSGDRGKVFAATAAALPKKTGWVVKVPPPKVPATTRRRRRPMKTMLAKVFRLPRFCDGAVGHPNSPTAPLCPCRPPTSDYFDQVVVPPLQPVPDSQTTRRAATMVQTTATMVQRTGGNDKTQHKTIRGGTPVLPRQQPRQVPPRMAAAPCSRPWKKHGPRTAARSARPLSGKVAPASDEVARDQARMVWQAEQEQAAMELWPNEPIVSYDMRCQGRCNLETPKRHRTTVFGAMLQAQAGAVHKHRFARPATAPMQRGVAESAEPSDAESSSRSAACRKNMKDEYRDEPAPPPSRQE
ncbi:unnamed protein product [Symbiodinium microadriaticum]|nr:unnamed protein product [Symbiodinium microadriaticum]